MKTLISLLFLSSMSFINSAEISQNSNTDELGFDFRPKFYQHANYNKARNDRNGGVLTIDCSEFELRNINWHDTISSIYIPQGQGWKVVIYEDSHYNDTNYNARVYTLTKSIPNLDKIRFNDKISSIKIYKHGILQDDCVWGN